MKKSLLVVLALTLFGCNRMDRYRVTPEHIEGAQALCAKSGGFKQIEYPRTYPVVEKIGEDYVKVGTTFVGNVECVDGVEHRLKKEIATVGDRNG